MKFDIRHIFRNLLVVPLALAVAFACSTYESPDNLYYRDYGTTYVYANDNAAANFYIVRDDGVTLYIKSNNANVFEATNEQRVRCNYEILSTNVDTRSTELKECDIKLHLIYDVLWKNPVYQDFIDKDYEWRTDSIGNDPVSKVTKMFYSGKYVNVEFTYLTQPKAETIHLLNLVVDEPDENGVIKARILHNAKGDKPSGSSETGFVEAESEMSFDLSALIPEGEDSVMIEFEWYEYGRQRPRTEKKLFTREPKGNTLIVGSIDGDDTLYHYFGNVR